MENRIKYWNHKQRDNKVKLLWNDYDDFFTWLDKFKGRINGKFSIKGDGFSCVIDYMGSTKTLKSYILTIIKTRNH